MKKTVKMIQMHSLEKRKPKQNQKNIKILKDISWYNFQQKKIRTASARRKTKDKAKGWQILA